MEYGRNFESPQLRLYGDVKRMAIQMVKILKLKRYMNKRNKKEGRYSTTNDEREMDV